MNVCTPNIGPRGRLRRLRGGALAFAAAVLLAVGLAAAGASAPVRALVLAPLLAAGYGFFQYREKT